MATDSEKFPAEELLSELAKSLAALRASPPIDEETRKNIESECTIRISLLEQLLRNRELQLQERAQIEEREIKNRELLLQERAQVDEKEVKNRELRIKEEASHIEKLANPLMVGIFVAGLGLLGSFFNGLWSNRNQAALLENQKVTERIKLENDLIKEAIKPASEQDRAKSLVFFAKNRLISLDPEVVKSLVAAAGTDQPVPGSTSIAEPSASAMPITFKQSTVERIRSNPGLTPFFAGAGELKKDGSHQVLAIILHDAVGPDASEMILKNGRADLPGPLAHWLVKSDGTIVLIAPETQTAHHLGIAKDGLTNANTIGVVVSGQPALTDDRQIESLIRLVINISERWGLPPDKIFSHAEVALPPGRKTDMLQQAPLVRDMVRAATAPSASP